MPTRTEIETAIKREAIVLGLDPAIALRVALAENPWLDPAAVGDDGSSFGIYQLHYGGIAGGGNAVPGLGDEFTKATGLHARNPNNWLETIRFALRHASRNGWGAFHAAEAVGISAWDGIRNIPAQVASTISKYVFPVEGFSGDVTRTYHGVGGTDIFAPLGTKVRSVASGVVKQIGINSGPGGNWALIEDDDGLQYYYAHMKDRPSISVGDRVNAAQEIGSVGKTGNAANTDPHLHIGIGYGITTGTGSEGGIGINFNAQTFLQSVLDQGGQIVAGIGESLNPSERLVKPAIDYTFQRFQEMISALFNRWRGYWAGQALDRGFYLAGALLIIAGVFALASQTPIVRDTVIMRAL